MKATNGKLVLRCSMEIVLDNGIVQIEHSSGITVINIMCKTLVFTRSTSAVYLYNSRRGHNFPVIHNRGGHNNHF